jgi:hypothetical protein
MIQMKHQTLVRRGLRLVIVVAGIYVVFLVAMFAIMRQPPDRFGQTMKHVPMPALMLLPFEPMWNVARGGALQVGDAAPDFTLPRTDRKSEVRLSALRGKPVVLVFGSYT